MADELLPSELIKSRIYMIRGRKVMLDKDLAELYGVETRRLNEQVKRNINRFPSDFMFLLSREEILTISQFATSLKFSKNVYAFTEQGVSMLSGVLNSNRAVEINIQIMRAFVEMRHYLISTGEIEQVLKDMLDKQVSEAMDALYKMVEDRMGGVAINTGNNSPVIISNSNITVTSGSKWSEALYDLIKRILADLNEVDLPAKAKEVIQASRETLNILIKEDKPAKGRVKECLMTIKTTLEVAAMGNTVAPVILDRIRQILALLG